MASVLGFIYLDNDTTNGPMNTLDYHIKIFVAGNLYELPELKELALRRIQPDLDRTIAVDDLITSIQSVYGEEGRDHDELQEVRWKLVNSLRLTLTDLLEEPAFVDLLTELSDFSLHLLRRAAGLGGSRLGIPSSHRQPREKATAMKPSDEKGATVREDFNDDKRLLMRKRRVLGWSGASGGGDTMVEIPGVEGRSWSGRQGDILGSALISHPTWISRT